MTTPVTSVTPLAGPSAKVRLAAMATWIFPLSIFLGLSEIRRLLGPVLADFAVVFAMAAGTLCGLGALIVGRRHVKRLLGHTIAGFVVIALFAAIFISNFVAGRERAAAARAQASQAQETSPILDPTEHAVLIQFQYGSTDLGELFALEDRIEAVLTPEVGELDGNEIAVDGSDGTLFLYGRDADRLWSTIEPIVRAAPFMRGAKVLLRYGGPSDAPEKTIVLSE